MSLLNESVSFQLSFPLACLPHILQLSLFPFHLISHSLLFPALSSSDLVISIIILADKKDDLTAKCANDES